MHPSLARSSSLRSRRTASCSHQHQRQLRPQRLSHLTQTLCLSQKGLVTQVVKALSSFIWICVCFLGYAFLVYLILAVFIPALLAI